MPKSILPISIENIIYDRGMEKKIPAAIDFRKQFIFNAIDLYLHAILTIPIEQRK